MNLAGPYGKAETPANDKESKLYPENSFTTPRNSADFQPIVNIVHMKGRNVNNVSKSSQGVYNRLDNI